MFGRIACRRIGWRVNNISVGRGASQSFSLLAASDSSASPNPSALTGASRTELSDQVHILGVDYRARYLAHLVAGCPGIPPVRLLIHLRQFSRQWRDCGRKITLFKDGKSMTQRNLEAEWVGPSSKPSVEPIHNLIVTVPAFAVTRALEHLRHRIDYRTMVCLVGEGLGVVDQLNETYFTSPVNRPTYFLGHMSQTLHYGKETYSVSEAHPGRLFLTALAPNSTSQLPLKIHPPIEVHDRVKHFFRLMSGTPGLKAGGYSTDDFLLRLLPHTVFRAVVDPISVVMNCAYGETLRNPHARQLMDELLGEIGQVILQLPELKGSNKVWSFVRQGELRKAVTRLIGRWGSLEGQALKMTQRGFESNIEYTTGFFINRGKQLGVKCPVSQTLLSLVKSIRDARATELQEYNPLDPY